MTALSVPAAQALYVGDSDSETDVKTARNAGIAIWTVTHGYNGGVPIADARPDRVLSGLQDLDPPH